MVYAFPLYNNTFLTLIITIIGNLLLHFFGGVLTLDSTFAIHLPFMFILLLKNSKEINSYLPRPLILWLTERKWYERIDNHRNSRYRLCSIVCRCVASKCWHRHRAQYASTQQYATEIVACRITYNPDGSKSQRVDIHYKFIGYVEMKETFELPMIIPVAKMLKLMMCW